MERKQKYFQQLSEEFKKICFIKGEKNAYWPYSNSLVIGNCLIDTGAGSRALRKVKSLFSIEKVILSHWHEDHLGGNRLFKNAKFFAHVNDKPIIEDISKMGKYYALENTQTGEDFEEIVELLRLGNTRIDQTIEDNLIIDVDENLKLQVIFTPGHTAGHCCFLELNSKIGFVADYDLTKFPFYGGIDANLTDFVNSIGKLKSLNMNIAVPSHKDVVMGTQEINNQLENFIIAIEKRSERILEHFSEKDPTNISDLIRKNLIYRKYSQEFEEIAERIMIEKHLEKLLNEKIIEPRNSGYILS